MNILVLTTIFPNPYAPNFGLYNEVQIRRLAESHRVRVIAPIPWNRELSARRAGKPALPAGRRIQGEGYEVDHPRFYFPPGVLRGLHGWFYLRSIGSTFRAAVSAFRPDVVFAAWAYPDAWAALILGRSAGLPVVAKVVGSDIHDPRPGTPRHRHTMKALRGVDAVVAVSQELAACVAALGVDLKRIRVVYNGIDQGCFFPGPKTEARRRLGLGDGTILLSVGNLVPVKGHDVLIDACAALHRGGRRFTSYVIGEGPSRTGLSRQIEQAGLSEVVKLIGALPHQELVDWFRAADVVVHPSRCEGIPNVLLEALACHTPYVASQVGGIGELPFSSACRLVPPEDPGALAAAVGAVLDAPSADPGQLELRAHRDAARELVSLFEQVIRERGGAMASTPR